jgi:hypothetical protein
MGLGSLDICSLANARQKSLGLRIAIYDGIDPIEQRQAKKLGAKESHQNCVTFKEAADRCIKTKQAEWSNSKHKDQWVSTINTYALPIIGKIRVDQITTAHIVKLLGQEIKKKNGEVEGSFWKVRTETATRVRQRIEVILDWCKAHKYISGDNPARYQGALCHLLPKANKIKRVAHHPALPFKRIGEFISDLRTHTGYSAYALELLILTATRKASSTVSFEYSVVSAAQSRNVDLRPCGTKSAYLGIFLIIASRAILDRARSLCRELGNKYEFTLIVFSCSRISMALLLSGTRCSLPAFIRSAGMIQTLASKSNSLHFASITSLVRVAVRISNSSA